MPVPPVDILDSLPYDVAVSAIGLDLASCGNGHLNEREQTTVLGVPAEKPIQGPEPLEQTLRIVQPVHADSEPDARSCADSPADQIHGQFHLRRGSALREGSKVHADGS